MTPRQCCIVCGALLLGLGILLNLRKERSTLHPR